MPHISERPQCEVLLSICENTGLSVILLPGHHQNKEQLSQTSGQLPDSRQLQGRGAEHQPTLDLYRMILTALYIVVFLAIIFTLNVPAPFKRQYENTPLGGVCTLLEGPEIGQNDLADTAKGRNDPDFNTAILRASIACDA